MKKEDLYINMTSGQFEVVKNFTPEDPPIYSQSQVDYLITAEREACAKVCEGGWKEGIGAKYQGDVFAEAIRVRGEK